jgi:hypothetical protein
MNAPAVVRAAREVGEGGLGVLDLPPLPSPTADVWGAPGCSVSCLDSTLHASEFAQLSAERAHPSGLRQQDIAGGHRFHPALVGCLGSPLWERQGGSFAYATSSKP